MRLSFFTALTTAALAAVTTPFTAAIDIQAIEVDDFLHGELAQICSRAECSVESVYSHQAQVESECESDTEIDDTLLSQVASYIESLSADDKVSMKSYLSEIGTSSDD